MNAANDGGPAFPVPDTHHPDGQIQYGANGMSLRDWFAGQALAGLMAGYQSGPMGIYACAQVAIETADAMLRARECGQEGANDDAWALHAAVTIHPAVGPESIHPSTWTARYWDGVRTLEESAPTIAAALRALRAKVEGGVQ